MTAINLYVGWKNGGNCGDSQPHHCQTSQKNRLAHIYRASSGGKPFPQAENNRRFATRYEKKILYFHAVVVLFGYFDGFKTDSS